MKISKKVWVLIIIAILILATNIYFYIPAEDRANYDDEFGEKLNFDLEFAMRWAPLVYQQISSDPLEPDLKYIADYITNINYDNDWIADNNWDNLEEYRDQLNAYTYYWGIENENYIILGFMFYHPRDWSDNYFGGEHENDAEGVILLLEQIQGDEYKPLLLSTLAHQSLYHYYLENTELPGNDQYFNNKFEGTFELLPNSTTPIIYSETMGHGIYGSKDELSDQSTSKFIQYTPGLTAGHPDELDNLTQQVQYRLLPIDDLWEKRYEEDLFTKSGFFNSDRSGSCGVRMLQLRMCQIFAAQPPWLWDQGQDYPGQLWYEPLMFFKILLFNSDST